MPDKSSYDLKSMKLPYLVGFPLRLFVALLEGPFGKLLAPGLLKSAGVSDFRVKEITDPPTLIPIHYTGQYSQTISALPRCEMPSPVPNSGPGHRFRTVYDYVKAYQEKKITPLEVAERVWDAIEHSNQSEPPLRAIIASSKEDMLNMARASTKRYEKDEPLGVFDGVPVAVKDELDMVPYPTKVGTSFLGKKTAVEDSTVVARMRQAGAMLIGKANMHEIGINVTGLNPHHGTTRNPYNPNHYTGGSSSGPATAVAAGLCPVAIGADGGGSIRIPCSFCGVFGIKSTFGRVSEHGAFPLGWSVAHLGPIAATATDAALAWGVLAGVDEKDPETYHQPAPTLQGWDLLDLSDLTIGVFWPWFRHASDEVVKACEAMLGNFNNLGAKVVEVEIPGLEDGRVAHLITIAAEMAQVLDSYHDEYGKTYGLDVRTNLTLARTFTARDYIKAQRVRTRLMDTFDQVLQKADVIVTPATGLVAPKIGPKVLPDGDSDLTTLNEIMRFAQPANMTGLPAIAFPVGYNKEGMPIGMQLMGRAWEESTLFRMALAAEQNVERRKPAWYYDILGG
jgi:Asp-tRNA(Asn)/Glu-tRNA(Gln) amidotransferase A subunit family amidase